MPRGSNCSVDWCERPERAKGFCKAHYRRSRDGSDMDKPIRGTRDQASFLCTVEDCDRLRVAKGFCKGHLDRSNRGIPLDTPFKGSIKTCAVESCTQPLKARGLCSTHYRRSRVGQDLTTPIRARYEGDKRGCLVPMCDGEYAAMGLCRTHTNQRINYGLTLERIIDLSKEGCGACGSFESLHIDHDHSCCPGGNDPKCGQCVRGVLCRGCNLGLGHFEDSPSRLRAAANYLEQALAKSLRLN